MLETVKNVMESLAAPAEGGLARSVAHGSVEVARRVGGVTANVARRIGPKRALFGLAVIGGLIGAGIAISRALRAKRPPARRDDDDVPDDAPDMLVMYEAQVGAHEHDPAFDADRSAPKPSRKHARGKRKHARMTH